MVVILMAILSLVVECLFLTACGILAYAVFGYRPPAGNIRSDYDEAEWKRAQRRHPSSRVPQPPNESNASLLPHPRSCHREHY